MGKGVRCARTGLEGWVYHCAREGVGAMVRDVALAKKLVVDGWWLLVNEGEGFPRWGKVCAGKVGAVSGYLCIQHVREVGENRRGWADSKKVCGLCAHGMGRIGLLLRAEYGGAIEGTWRLLIIQGTQEKIGGR